MKSIRLHAVPWTVCLLLSLAGVPRAGAIEIRWHPARPSHHDAVEIEVLDCTQGGTLHWGVNAENHHWQPAMPPHRPPGSIMDGVATRTPLAGPDADGTCRVSLGPFNDTNQHVRSIDFAIQWQNQNWENHQGQDFHIPVGPLRITAEPQEPHLNDVLSITVHESAPNGWLHWGVNASEEEWRQPVSDYWPTGTVLFADGQAVETPLPTPDARGNSVLRLGPFHAGAQMVTSLHMVVRWGDEWDTDYGRNYDVVIADDPRTDGPGLVLLAPEPDARIEDRLTVALQVTNARSAGIWLDGELVAQMETEPYVWHASAANLGYGPHRVAARAWQNGRAALKETTIWHVPRYETMDLAPDTPLGVSIHPDGTATFALHAPAKKFVSLVGDFNHWDERADIMHYSSEGTWWLRRPVNPGRHLYQYHLDGIRNVADPYAREISWPAAVPPQVSPAKSVLEVGRKPYAWSDQSFRRPPLENLLIYEFFIDDLCPGQGYTGVIARLDYIRDLGATAIEPLPWTEYRGERGWGYNPAFHFAPESSYGTPNELKTMIDAAHARGLAVIMDVVLNHMDAQSALFQLYGKDYDASPYFHLFTGENWGFPDVEQTSPAVKRYAADMIAFWLQAYHVDGFRYDATRWVEWSGYNDWGASWFAWAGRQADSGSYQIAEHIPADPLLINNTEMDTGWQAHFRWRLREMVENGALDPEEFTRIMDPTHAGFTNAFQCIVYVESHDEERLLRELLKKGVSWEEALRRAETAAAITLTAPGVAMIYAGQEFGEYTTRVVGRNPLHWDQLELPPFARLQERFARLSRLRTSHPALRTGHVDHLVLDTDLDVLAYARLAEGAGVIVAANLSSAAREVRFQLPEGNPWFDAQHAASAAQPLTGPFAALLQPGESVVLQRGGASGPAHE